MNNPILRLLAIGLACLLANSAMAAPAVPAVNSYAFDWLDPEHTRCKKLTEPEVSKMAGKCNTKSNGFGEHKPTHQCRLSSRKEIFVYATQRECQNELETMQANAP